MGRVGRDAGAPYRMAGRAGAKSAILRFTIFMPGLGQPGTLTLTSRVPSTGRWTWRAMISY